mgnify:CR=1 FL=1
MKYTYMKYREKERKRTPKSLRLYEIYLTGPQVRNPSPHRTNEIAIRAPLMIVGRSCPSNFIKGLNSMIL